MNMIDEPAVKVTPRYGYSYMNLLTDVVEKNILAMTNSLA